MIIDNSAFEVLLKGAFLCRNARFTREARVTGPLKGPLDPRSTRCQRYKFHKWANQSRVEGYHFDFAPLYA